MTRRSPSSALVLVVLSGLACADRPRVDRPDGSGETAFEQTDPAERTDSTARPFDRGTCTAPEASMALDHVVVAVEDLETAVADYARAGFTIKPGRPHSNGLLNAHVKFPDGTQLELMSVPGPPTDEIARGYRDFLRGGEGGAFVAFRAPRDRVLPAARRVGVRADTLGDAYVVFSELPRVFALRPGRFGAVDPDSLLTHANGAAGIEEAWLEADEVLAELLVALGARDCGPVEPPPLARSRGPGRAFAVANGRIVLLPVEDPKRPLVRGVVLRSARPVLPVSVSHERAHGLWVGFTSR